MSRTRKFVITFICMVLWVSGTTVLFAQTEPLIDVGLYFGGNTEYPLEIGSDFGLKIELYESDTLIPLVELNDLTRFSVFKMGYYQTNSSGAQQLVTSTEAYYQNNHVKGGYRLRTGLSFETYAQAYQEISSTEMPFYLTFDGVWHVDYGHYVNEAEALQDLDKIKDVYPSATPMVFEGSPKDIALVSNDKTLLVLNTDADLFFRTDLFHIGNGAYRNGFVVKRLPGSDLTLINRLPISQYLYGVLPKEMSAGWPLEALKAQAVAARNYAIKNLGKYAHYGFDLCTTVKSQVYGGYNVEQAQSNLAVDLTQGLVLTHEGEISESYYHAHSGGYTDAVENIWSASLPYIQPVEDVFSIASGAPVTNWSLNLSSSEIEQRLIEAGYNIGRLSKVRILERTESGRVTTLQFVGSFSTATLTKESPRFIFGTTVLKSMVFGFDASKALAQIPDQLPMPDLVMTPANKISLEGVYGEYASADTVRLVTSRGVFESRLNALKPNISEPTSSKTIQVFEEMNVSNGQVTFYGHGYGHGLGMSQWGAKKMAELGFTFDQILAHYYKDTVLVGQYNNSY